MVVFPQSTWTVLGFDTIRSRVADFIVSEDARERWASEDPASNTEEARRRLDTVAEFQGVLRAEESVPLQSVFEPGPLLAKARPRSAMLEVEELRRIGDLMGDAAAARTYLFRNADQYPLLNTVVETVVPTPDLVAAVDRAIDERGDIRDDASPALKATRRQIGKAEASLRSSLDQALAHARSQGFDGGDQPTVRNGRMVIPIRAEAKRKVGGLVHDISSSGQTAFIEPQASLELNNTLNELRADEKREIRRILIGLTDLVRENGDAIRHAAAALLELDGIQAKARLCNLLGAVAPDLVTKSTIRLRGARHPILLLRAIEAGASLDEARRQIVPLDLDLGDDASTLVLSGPNAGGKTVVLKTVGLFSLMLAYGIPVPARQESILFFPERVLVDIGDEQSVENDLSTFGARIVHLREIVQKADEASLVLIDEAGSGTDPAEGVALAQAVLEHVTRSGAVTLASTHHQRLKLFAMEHDRVVNGSMLIDAASLTPTYRFRADVAGSSYGLAIARREGLPEPLIRRAEELAGTASVSLDKLLAEQSEKVRLLDEERAGIREREEAIADEREQLSALRTSLASQKKALKQAAARDATDLIESANARIERTIREIRESAADKKATRKARVDLEAYREKLEEVAQPDSTGTPDAREGIATPLAPGDRVVLDGGTTTVEVVAVTDTDVEISSGSIRMRVERSRLQKVGGKQPQRSMVRRPTPEAGAEIPLRLDLRGSRVDEAVWKVTQHVDRALSAGLDHVEILHGKGTGALRSAIRAHLEERPDVGHIADAPIEQGGSGVTVVRLG